MLTKTLKWSLILDFQQLRYDCILPEAVVGFVATDVHRSAVLVLDEVEVRIERSNEVKRIIFDRLFTPVWIRRCFRDVDLSRSKRTSLWSVCFMFLKTFHEWTVNVILKTPSGYTSLKEIYLVDKRVLSRRSSFSFSSFCIGLCKRAVL